MSSIFDVSFKANLTRIGHVPGESRSKVSGGKEFAKVLADLEQTPNNLNKMNALNDLPDSSVDLDLTSESQVSYLSNLNSADIKTLNARQLYGKYELQNGEIITREGVNTPLKPVKMIAMNSPAEFRPYGWGIDVTRNGSMENSANQSRTTIPQGNSDSNLLNPPHIKSPLGLEPKVTQKPIDTKLAEEMKSIINLAGKFHGVDPFLGIAVAQSESSLNPEAVSKDGFNSKGLFQLLDTTAKDMIDRLDVKENYKPFDPKTNSHLGVGYLRYLLGVFSEGSFVGPNLKAVSAKSALDLEKLAVAAFNAGEGAVARAQNQAMELGLNGGEFAAIEKYLPKITRTYVDRVRETKESLERNSAQS